MCRIGAAYEYYDMDLRVSLKASLYREWLPCVGTITATMTWNAHGRKKVDHFELYADGTSVGSSGRDGTMECIVAQKELASFEYERWVRDYMDWEHEYKVEIHPQPNAGPILYDKFIYIPPNVLQIENHVAGLASTAIHAFELRTNELASDAIDNNDVPSRLDPLTVESKVVSVVVDLSSGARHELAVDSRPRNGITELQLELSLICPEGSIPLAAATANELRFTLPDTTWGHNFSALPITIQRYDPAAPSTRYPVYDVRRLIVSNGGALPLPDLQGTYVSGEPYAYFKLGFMQKPSVDLNADGRVDLPDFALFADGWRDNETLLLDIGGCKGLGVPDRVTDCWDLLAFCQEWGGPVERFSNGTFNDLPWTLLGWPQWTITASPSHSSPYCAQAGRIGDNNTTALAVTLDCTAGRIRFWRKVSSESYADYLRFRIDSTVKDKWSGEKDWEEVSFPVPAGRHLFVWEYVKDRDVARGEDTAWVDDIMFPRQWNSPH
ncbi:MAG: hypothetical protein A2Y76_00210 [Planctomycetes bacterium RBG_13_60_9]|nr:MAG: hypothetical protein A2Y76_00210 [Planctomycetes bacterium RBG_13_60_9]